jgi:hypothetical protein
VTLDEQVVEIDLERVNMAAFVDTTRELVKAKRRAPEDFARREERLRNVRVICRTLKLLQKHRDKVDPALLALIEKPIAEVDGVPKTGVD